MPDRSLLSAQVWLQPAPTSSIPGCSIAAGRCRPRPNGHLDLWAREHCKTSIITFGLTTARHPQRSEMTIGIFSHTRPIAKGFLRQIKREIETNEHLKAGSPTSCGQPGAGSAEVVRGRRHHRQAQDQSEGKHGRGVGPDRRQPAGKHFRVRVYDDVVTPAQRRPRRR